MRMWRFLLLLGATASAGRRHRGGHLVNSASDPDDDRRDNRDFYLRKTVKDKGDDFFLRFREGRVDDIPETIRVRVNSRIVNRYAVTQMEKRVFNPKKDKQMVDMVVFMPPHALVSDVTLRGERFLVERIDEENVDGSDVNGLKNVSATLQTVHSSSLDVKFQELVVPVMMEPLENVTFGIIYEELLSRKSGKYQYSLNLKIGEVIPDFTVRIEIKDHANITGVVVTAPVIGDTTMEALKEHKNKHEKIIEFDMTVQEQGYYFGSDGFSGNLLTEYDVSTTEDEVDFAVEDGYFVHFFKGPDNLPPIPKHVMLVVDNSISVNKGVVTASEIAMKVIQNLNPEDYLNIISFNGSVLEWNPTNKMGTSPLQQAFKCLPQVKQNGIDFVQGLQKEGSSDAMATIQSATFVGQRIQLSETLPDNVFSMMLIIMENQTEIEERKPETLTIVDPNGISFPIYTFSLGDKSQSNALQQLSRMTEGSFYNIDPIESIDNQLQFFLVQFHEVLLKNVDISFEDDMVHTESLTKTKFDYFKNGTNLAVAGKFNNSIKGTFEPVLGGQCFNGTYTKQESAANLVNTYRFNEAKDSTTNHAQRIWSNMKIQEGMSSSLPNQAANLSMKNNFLTPFTQFVLKTNNTKIVLKYNKEEIYVEDKHNTHFSIDDISSKKSQNAKSISTPNIDISQLFNVTSQFLNERHRAGNLTEEHQQNWFKILSDGHSALARESLDALKILDENINATTKDALKIVNAKRQDGSLTKQKQRELDGITKGIIGKMVHKIIKDLGLNEEDLDMEADLINYIKSIDAQIGKITKMEEGTCSSTLTLTGLNGKQVILTSSDPWLHLVGVSYVRKIPEEEFCCWNLYTQPQYQGMKQKFCGRYGPVNLHQVKSVRRI